MTEIAKEALELAVRAGNPGEQPEITARRARTFYEFLRAPVGASVQGATTATAVSYATLGDAQKHSNWSANQNAQSALNSGGAIPLSHL